MSETLTLAQASIRLGVSVTTLRRRVQSGTLRAEQRANTRQPVLVSLQALEEAGLISQVDTQMSTQAVSDTASEVRAQMLAERVQALEAKLREVRAKAEQASELVGEVRAWRQIAEEAQLRLAEAGQLAIQPISQVDTQMSTQAVPEPSRGFSWRFRRKG